MQGTQQEADPHGTKASAGLRWSPGDSGRGPGVLLAPPTPRSHTSPRAETLPGGSHSPSSLLSVNLYASLPVTLPCPCSQRLGCEGRTGNDFP